MYIIIFCIEMNWNGSLCWKTKITQQRRMVELHTHKMCTTRIQRNTETESERVRARERERQAVWSRVQVLSASMCASLTHVIRAYAHKITPKPVSVSRYTIYMHACIHDCVWDDIVWLVANIFNVTYKMLCFFFKCIFLSLKSSL